MPQTFDQERWEQSRRDHQQRVEIEAAKLSVGAGRVRRACKPGFWRVFKDEAGNVVAEVF